MELQPAAPSFALTVKLWGYCGDRHTERHDAPYSGGSVDNQGTVPGPWTLDAETCLSQTNFL